MRLFLSGSTDGLAGLFNSVATSALRTSLGGVPCSRRKSREKWLGSLYPTRAMISFTLRNERSTSSRARRSRNRCRYRIGARPVWMVNRELNRDRERFTLEARASTVSGSDIRCCMNSTIQVIRGSGLARFMRTTVSSFVRSGRASADRSPAGREGGDGRREVRGWRFWFCRFRFQVLRFRDLKVTETAITAIAPFNDARRVLRPSLVRLLRRCRTRRAGRLPPRIATRWRARSRCRLRRSRSPRA